MQQLLQKVPVSAWISDKKIVDQYNISKLELESCCGYSKTSSLALALNPPLPCRAAYFLNLNELGILGTT